MPEELPPLERAQRALDEGDWQQARTILAGLDRASLSPDDARRAADLRAMIRPDPVATAIAVSLGVGLLAIVIALYI